MKKAYSYTDEDDGFVHIYYAETRNQAKRMVADEWMIPYIEVKVYRLPWADEYGDQSNIPDEEYIKRGWWVLCKGCGCKELSEENLQDGSAEYVEGIIVCSECAKTLRKKFNEISIRFKDFL